jgi:hypothetical protein
MAGIDNLRPFKKGENGTRSPTAHRPPNRIKAIMKADPISSQDRKNLADMMLNASPDEIKQLASDPMQPMFIVTIALSLLEDAKKRRYTTWEMLLNWNLGEAVQPTVNVSKVDLTSLTDEEYEARKASFLKENLPLVRKMAAEVKENKPKAKLGRPKKNPNQE